MNSKSSCYEIFRSENWNENLYRIFVHVVVVVGSVGYFRLSNVSDDLKGVGQNRIPDLIDFSQINYQRMMIRSQTLEVLTLENQEEIKTQLQGIFEKRQSSWQIVDKAWASIAGRQRFSEKGKELINKVKGEYADWRAIYVELDAIIQKLAIVNEDK